MWCLLFLNSFLSWICMDLFLFFFHEFSLNYRTFVHEMKKYNVYLIFFLYFTFSLWVTLGKDWILPFAN
jgi:hypothetical protein